MAETDETPPVVVLSLASFARSGPAAAARQAVAVPCASGWITLHASLPESRGEGRVAIVLERLPTQQATTLRLEAHGVTPREREVATLLAQGLSNHEIATTLVLSPFTIQDHVKSLYEKTGVSSHRELVARIFLDDYLPGITRGVPLATTGGFVQPPAARS